jgi:hypothetical protein
MVWIDAQAPIRNDLVGQFADLLVGRKMLGKATRGPCYRRARIADEVVTLDRETVLCEIDY